MRPAPSDGCGMNDQPNPTPQPNDREEARRKLIGRFMVVLLLGLVAVYVVVTFWR